MTFDLDTTDRLLTTTRAVRKRLDLDRPVPREVIERCLEIAIQAPSGSNRQGWQWIVVTDEAKRAALADLYRRGTGEYLDLAMAQAREGGRAQDLRVFDSARYLVDQFHRVPVHVIPCIRAKLAPDAGIAAWASVMGWIFPAVWSFQLALRARGLGTVLTTLHLNCADEAAKLLGLPEDLMQVALLPVAYTIGTDFKPAPRRGLESVVHWEGWTDAGA